MTSDDRATAQGLTVKEWLLRLDQKLDDHGDRLTTIETTLKVAAASNTAARQARGQILAIGKTTLAAIAGAITLTATLASLVLGHVIH